MRYTWFCKLILFLLLLPTYESVQAQARQKIDSLVQLLRTHPHQDSVHVDLLNEIGFEYWTIEPQESENYGKDALIIAENIKYTSGMAMAHRVIGVSHWSRGDFFKALTHLLNSQKLYKLNGDELGEANSTMNIGLVYADQKDYGRALENFQYANQLFERLNRSDRVGITYNKIGTVYLEKGDLIKAKEYLSKGLEIHRTHNFSFGIMEAENRLGLLNRELGEYEIALEYLENSLEQARRNNDLEHTIKNLENLASVLIIKKQFGKAKVLLDEAYPLAVSNQYRKWLRDILKDYRDIYVAQKNSVQALYYTDRYEAIKDSIFSEEKATQIANLELEYQAAQQQQALKLREQQILLLQQQTKAERLLNILLISGIIAVLLLGYLFFRYQQLRFKKNQELAVREHELAKIELENSQLREEELKQSLEFKNKELTAYTVNFIRKNELIEQLKEKLDALRSSLPEQSKELTPLYSLLQQTPGIDKDWEDFKRTFENVHHNFFGRLLEQYPDLTQSELRLCALICLNLSIKEMSSLMGISPDSVKTARYRLRKRFNLQQDQNLTDFVIAFS